jgi:hypothetical protein
VKRACHAHPKLYDLADALGISRTHAVGILESLWHLTGTQRIHGDIGTLTNRQIARALDWPDPDRLIKALVESGWVDENPVHRLVVHNWHKHCDEWVRKAVARSGSPFASLTESKSDNGGTWSDKKCLPSRAEPEPEPEPSQSLARAEPPPAGADSSGWGWLAGRRPEPTDMPDALLARLGVSDRVRREIVAAGVPPSVILAAAREIVADPTVVSPVRALVSRLRPPTRDGPLAPAVAAAARSLTGLVDRRNAKKPMPE